MLSEYLDQRIDIRGPDECWPWLLSAGSHGYGQAWTGSKVTVAHRMAWEAVNGPIPKGMWIDHICLLRKCCNPAHLRILTPAQNGRRNKHLWKNVCPQGHLYDKENTYYDTQGHRRCRRCRDRWR